MRTFLCDGARLLQQQGWTLFSLEQKSFPYRNPSFWAYFAGSFPYRICSQVYPKRGEQVIHSLFERGRQEIPTWRRQHILTLSPCVPSASGAFSLNPVGFACFFSPTMPSFRIPILPSAMMNPRPTAPFLPSLYPFINLSLSVNINQYQNILFPQPN